MGKLHYSILIKAPKEKVWHSMLDDKTYREWTKPFSEGSYYKGSWEKGSKMLFMGPDPKTGKEGGMVARIAENKLYEYISIEHLGTINDGVEDTTSEEVKKWAHAHENYTLIEKDGTTELLIDLESNMEDKYAEMFNEMWPKALDILKDIAER